MDHRLDLVAPTTVAAAPFAAARFDGDQPAWLAARREEAWTRYASQGFPTGKEEKWLGADVSAFTAEGDLAAPADVPKGALAGIHFGDAPRIVIVDGVPDWDRNEDAPPGWRVLPIASDDEVPRVHFESTPEPDAFTDLNTACFRDGLLIDADGPGILHIVHLRTPQEGTVAFPRVLVHARPNADVTVIEQVVGVRDADDLTLGVTELCAHEGATLRHILLNDAAPHGRHLHAVRGRQERNATIEQHNLCWGGASVRCTVVVDQVGTGCTSILNGLTLTKGTQRVDNWTRIRHAVPHGTSRQLYKSVLDDKSRTRFTGNIVVEQDAQKVDSQQENRNLVLSRGALAESTPQLEIHADDVQCAHGSTVGRLDEEQLFFLRSRGIGKEEAVVLLTKAFAAEVVERLPVPEVRAKASARIESWFEEEHA